MGINRSFEDVKKDIPLIFMASRNVPLTSSAIEMAYRQAGFVVPVRRIGNALSQLSKLGVVSWIDVRTGDSLMVGEKEIRISKRMWLPTGKITARMRIKSILYGRGHLKNAAVLPSSILAYEKQPEAPKRKRGRPRKDAK